MAEEATVPAGENTTPESVTTPTNTNTEPKAPESVTPFFDKMSESDRASIDKFLANNGGIEAFNKWKQSVSNPAPKAEPAQPAQPVAQQQPAQPQRPAEGFLTPTDIAALQYRNMLANDSRYEKIKDYIAGTDEAKSDYLRDMKSFGMNPVDANGNLNDAVIRRFLDLKAATVPATQTTDPITAIPTVDYVAVGDTINNRDDAYAIIQQNMALRAQGKPEHPRTEDAKKFIKEYWSGRKK